MSSKKVTRKTQVIRALLAIGTITSLFFVPWVLLKALILPLPETVEGQLDQAIGHGFDGIVVYVDQKGKKPAFYGAGWKNREKKVPADPKALFKIASIGKLYDAISITKLVHDNKLSLEGTLANYLPELTGRIAYADQITIRMMVQHRSGIPNFTDTPNYWVSPPGNADDALALILDLPAEFKPNEKYNYCNTNYLLLQMVVERVTGRPHFDFIQKEILEPLNLKNTYRSIEDINMDDLMSGYYVGIAEDIKEDNQGSMIATAEDVGKLIRAMQDGSVFDVGEKETYASIYEFGHGGLIPGYQSYAYYHGDIDAVVVQFVNTTDFSGYEWNLHQIVYNRIVKILRRASWKGRNRSNELGPAN